MSASPQRYTTVAIALHWAIAVSIIGMIFGGWYMTDLPDGAPGQYFLFQLHKSLGITILLLTVTRILWRVMNPPPALPDDMEGYEKTLSHLVHMGFYALMIILPLTGWLYSSVSVKLDVPTVLYGVLSWPDVPFVEGLKTEAASGAVNQAHGLLAWVALALLGLHVAGAIKHEIGSEGSVLKRMVPGLSGADSGPKPEGRGALIAFGSALGLLIVVTGATPIVTALSGAKQAVSVEASFEPNWTVDYELSSISFSGTHDGSPYSGAFGNWDAAIQFDSDSLETAEARVTVSTGSAEASQKLYTDSLKSPEWFNVAAFPSANVEILDIKDQGDGTYASTARLTLNELTVDATFPFSLEIDGDTARMTGTAIFQRKALNLGQASDPGADWVAEDVTVDVIVEATRLN